MYRQRLFLGLAVVLAQLFLFQGFAIAEKRPSRAISIRTPNAWYLNINSDGSGRVGYGSSGPDSWGFKAGTFDIEKVNKDLKALTNDENGKMGSHFLFFLESERLAPDKPGPARYSRDNTVIPALLAKAIEAAEVKKSDRGTLLMKEYPPGLSKGK
jgi:hypothetical protein